MLLVLSVISQCGWGHTDLWISAVEYWQYLSARSKEKFNISYTYTCV
jgi:hypothetical protein